MPASSGLETKASKEAALLVGGRGGRGVFVLLWIKYDPSKSCKLEVNISLQAAIPNNFRACTYASIKGAPWCEMKWPFEGSTEDSVSGCKLEREEKLRWSSQTKLWNRCEYGIDTGFVSCLWDSGPLSEGNRVSEEWQMTGCKQALAKWKRGISKGKAKMTDPVVFHYWECFSPYSTVAKRSILFFCVLRRKELHFSSYLPSAPELPTGPVLGLQGRVMFQARSNYSSWFQPPGWQLT